MLIEHFARLGPQHRTAVAVHLMSLDSESRVLRFGGPARDEVLTRYVAGIDFERDIVEGVWDEGRLVGVAHLAVFMENGQLVGELGISVLPSARQQGLGQRLLSRVLLQGRLLRLTCVYVHFVTRNRPMARLAREFTNIVELKHGNVLATIDMGNTGREAA
jgi:GNAT superfamily N-acetyltransferase